MLSSPWPEADRCRGVDPLATAQESDSGFDDDDDDSRGCGSTLTVAVFRRNSRPEKMGEGLWSSVRNYLLFFLDFYGLCLAQFSKELDTETNGKHKCISSIIDIYSHTKFQLEHIRI